MRGGVRGCGGLGDFSQLSKVPGAGLLGGLRRVFSQTLDLADPDRADTLHLPAMCSIASGTDSSTAQPCSGQSQQTVALDHGMRRNADPKAARQSPHCSGSSRPDLHVERSFCATSRTFRPSRVVGAAGAGATGSRRFSRIRRARLSTLSGAWSKACPALLSVHSR